jgi:hypothetical protein
MRSLFLLFSFFSSAALFGQSAVTRDIRSFGAKGDGKTNDHEAFQKAAQFFNKRGGHGKLIIPKGTYIIGKQDFNQKTTTKPVYEGYDALSFKDVKNLVIQARKGAVIKYKDSLRYGAFDPETGKPHLHGTNNFVKTPYIASVGSAILVRNGKNIQIQGLTLDGNSDGLIVGGTWGDVNIQLPHIGIYAINCTNFTLDGVYIHHFGLDGALIANKTGESEEPDKVLIKKSRFEYNGRQGMSWTGGNDLTAIDSKFNHTGRGKIYASPGAGVDIEAEMGPIRNGKFIRCEFVNNAGAGVVADSGPSKDCTFTDCTFWGVTYWSLWINKPGFTVIDSRIYGSFVHGYDAKTDEEATVFRNCLFEDKPYNGKEPYGKFLIETNYRRRVRFDNCTMIAHKKKVVWMEAAKEWKPEEKYQLNNCRLIYLGEGDEPAGKWVALMRSVRIKNCTFEMRGQEAEMKKYYYNGVDAAYNANLGGNKILVNKREIKL